jgi:integrase
MENGVESKWLQKQLGQAALAMTADLYGHYGDEARKKQIAKLEVAFTV